MTAVLLPSSFVPSALYVEGLRAGIVARGAFSQKRPHLLEDAIALLGDKGVSDRSGLEESANGSHGESHFDVPSRLADCAAQDRAPDAEERLCFAEHGLAYLGPDKDGFAIHVVLPHGSLEPGQLRGLATVCQQFANGCVSLSGQGGVSLRVVSVGDAPEVRRRIEALNLRMSKLPSDTVENYLGLPRSDTGSCELPVPQGCLLSGQMLALAALLDAEGDRGMIYLSSTAGLILPRGNLKDAAAILASG